jgi:hypothetical protein
MVGWLGRVHNFTGRNESVFGALRDAVAGWLAIQGGWEQTGAYATLAVLSDPGCPRR